MEDKPMKSKQQKRIEAQERQEEYDSLTLIEKVNRLNRRPGHCYKERAKLSKAIENPDNKVY
jgi:hypothetical protein